MNSLEQEYEGKLSCEVLDATTPENKAQVKAYGFGNHGLVVIDEQGNARNKMDGHLMREPEIRAALKEVMAGS